MRVGRLTKAHGLKGAIKVELYTDDPGRRFSPGAVFRLQVPDSSPWHSKTLELAELKWYNTHPVAFFAGVSDRETAETLVKAILWVEQDTSELPAEDDAWYDHQLVGLAVLRDGVRVGTVARVDHLPAQDLLLVNTADGEVLVPFVKAIVPAVDIVAGTLTVTPPLGLFEEIAEETFPQEDVSEYAVPEERVAGILTGDTDSTASDSEGSPASGHPSSTSDVRVD